MLAEMQQQFLDVVLWYKSLFHFAAAHNYLHTKEQYPFVRLQLTEIWMFPQSSGGRLQNEVPMGPGTRP
jgi:hypothetical protein